MGSSCGRPARLLVIASALLAPFIVPHDPLDEDLVTRNMPPPAFLPRGTWAYPLGTDALGRDLFSRIVYGGRVSLIVGVVAVTVSGTIGVALGLVSGYYGGRIEQIVMRFADVQLSFPFILLAIAVIAVLGWDCVT